MIQKQDVSGPCMYKKKKIPFQIPLSHMHVGYITTFLMGCSLSFYHIPVHGNIAVFSQGGAVKIESGPLWFEAQHKTILIVIQTILMQFL